MAKRRLPGSVGDTDLAGTLKSASDGREARLELSLTEPTPASATLTIGQNSAAPWTLQLDVPRFAANRVLPDSTLGAACPAPRRQR